MFKLATQNESGDTLTIEEYETVDMLLLTVNSKSNYGTATNCAFSISKNDFGLISKWFGCSESKEKLTAICPRVHNVEQD
jgi:hypothetical protein